MIGKICFFVHFGVGKAADFGLYSAGCEIGTHQNVVEKAVLVVRVRGSGEF